MLMLNEIPWDTQRRHVLLLGESGSGKTTFAGTFPKPFIADFELKAKETLAGKDVGVKEYEKWASFWSDLQAIGKEAKPGQFTLEGHTFESLIIDSISFAGDIMVRDFAKPQLTIADWGLIAKRTEEFLLFIRGLPFHVMVTCHLTMEQSETEGLVWLPMMPGKKMPHKIAAYFNDVWAMSFVVDNKERRHVVLTEKTPRFRLLKNTARGQWQAEETPNFVSMLNKLTGDKK